MQTHYIKHHRNEDVQYITLKIEDAYNKLENSQI